MLNKKQLRLLFELIKNSKRSDRQVSKIIGVSQPTITRMRQRLEKKAIMEYTVTPNMTDLGYELLAVTLISTKGPAKSEEGQKETLEKRSKWMMKQPNIVFACDGGGMDMDEMVISIHKDYTDFLELMTKLRFEWSGTIDKTQTFIASLKGGVILKPYSLKYLEEVTQV